MVAQFLLSQLIIQWISNLSVKLPKYAPQNMSCKGIPTEPPSDNGAHLDLASIGQYEAGLRNLDCLLRIPES